MTFLAPQLLYLLTLAPCAGFVLLVAVFARRRALTRFYGNGAGTPRPWVPRASLTRSILSAALWSLAIACVVLALARPAHSPQARKVERTGRDVVFVIDVSRSMLAQDLRPNRLARAKLMVGDVLDAAEGDRVGIVAFAGSPVERCPMTTDYAFARMSLDAIGPDSVGRGGTAIGDAIRSALKLIRADQQEGGGGGPVAADIYLLTDGEDHETRPLEAATEAGAQGVRLVCIGLGSDLGAPVPVDPEQAAQARTDGRANSKEGFMRYGGEQVQSRRNPESLRTMADATPGGVFLDVGTGNLELDRVYQLLRRDGERKQFDASESVRYTEVFQWPLGGALCLGMIAMLIEGLHIRRTPRPPANNGVGAVAATIFLCVFVIATPARAQSIRDDVGAGTRLLEVGKAGEALSLFEGATLRHADSPDVALGRGCAQLAAGQTEEAESSFRRAEQLALNANAAGNGQRDNATAARARYNLGLIEAARAAAQAEKDPEVAMKTLAQAERWFRNARPGLPEKERSAAASSVEQLQKAREALRRQVAEQKKQQQQDKQPGQSQSGDSGQSGDGKSGPPGQPPTEPQSPNQPPQGQSEEQKAAEDLADLARKQDEAAEDSSKAEKQPPESKTAQQKQEESQKLADAQRELSERAAELDQQLQKQQAAENAKPQQEQQPGGPKPSEQAENLSRSRDRLDEARRAQARAEEQLRQSDTKGAEQSQREAAEKIEDAARAALGIDQQPGEEQGEAEAQEQPNAEKPGEPQRAFSAAAASILDREARTREAIRKFLKSQQRTRTPPVEKDW